MRLVIAVFGLLVASALAGGLPMPLTGLDYSIRVNDWSIPPCKSLEQVTHELTLARNQTGVEQVKIYSISECNGAEVLLSVMRWAENPNGLDMNVFLGMWTTSNKTLFEVEIAALEQLIKDHKPWFSRVLGISVGSEGIYRKDHTVDDAIYMVKRTQDLMESYGLGQLPVTYTDITYSYFNVSLVDQVDLVMANNFPYWEASPIEDAYARTLTNYRDLAGFAALRNKTVVLGEIGWPDKSGSSLPGQGVPSPANMQKYYADFVCNIAKDGFPDYYWFEFGDEPWKGDVSDPVEAHWGLYWPNNTIKEYMTVPFSC